MLRPHPRAGGPRFGIPLNKDRKRFANAGILAEEQRCTGKNAMHCALFDHPDFDGHEQVVLACDPAAGLRAIIAVHDTGLGPALGGCRVYDYPDDASALTDALRLSRGMSYKAALAGLALGGGKAVILTGPGRRKTPAMMRAFGRAIDRLGGRYITAEDVGSTVADMDEVARETAHVAGHAAGAGDPSPFTARGVFLCLEAAVRHRLGRDLVGVHVAIKGLGNVGSSLAEQLHRAGARLTVADIDPARVARAREAWGAAAAPVEAIAGVAADVFAPCALGGDLAEATIPSLRARIVCGAANNQLARPEDDARLARAGILYCPDYLVNAGGLIHVAQGPLGLARAGVEERLAALPATLLAVLERAAREGKAPGAAADQLARARFRPEPRAADGVTLMFGKVI
jgi:leucine dehydrogenase